VGGQPVEAGELLVKDRDDPSAGWDGHDPVVAVDLRRLLGGEIY
jgi:hypothetical protein